MVTSNVRLSTQPSTLSSSPRSSSWDGVNVPLSDVGVPMAACSSAGEVLGLTPPARAILEGVGISTENPPFALPAKLWADLAVAPEGEAIEWQPEGTASGASLGCTRYGFGADRFIVLMREVSAKRRELSRRLHRQRLESTGRLAASIAHDVRTALASILYNADFLVNAGPGLPARDLVETANEIHAASRRLETICAGLLGFAKLGPPVADDVALRDVVSRACSLVRPMYRERGHELKSQFAQDSLRVCGNAILLDQILVNLLVNAAEASEAPVHVLLECSSGPAAADGAARVRISVTDDGPGVPAGLRQSIFHPFFTTHADGSGLGLTTAREAAQEMGGELLLEPTARGARFVALLLAGRGERA